MNNSNKYSGRKLRKPDMAKERKFTQIPNAFILNPEIGDPEMRLLLYIMMHKDYRLITTKDCLRYLNKTKPPITRAFEKLVALGILIITDEFIEVIIPEEMKKYKLGYLRGQENFTDEVKITLPTESHEIIQEGKENYTPEVKKTLLSSKENYTQEVKISYKKPLEDADNKDNTSPIILYNTTRVLPVPATSGSTGQSHSNNNTNDNTGIKLDLECDKLQSQASPSVLAPSLHTPMGKVENKGKESSLPQWDDDSVRLTLDDKNTNSSSSNCFHNESELHTSIHEKNDLDLVLKNVPHFNLMYENCKWNEIDIASFSNKDIAKLIIEKEKNIKDDSIPSSTYLFLTKLIKYSSRLEDDSKLWIEFKRQCKSENRLKLISEITNS